MWFPAGWSVSHYREIHSPDRLQIRVSQYPALRVKPGCEHNLGVRLGRKLEISRSVCKLHSFPCFQHGTHPPLNCAWCPRPEMLLSSENKPVTQQGWVRPWREVVVACWTSRCLIRCLFSLTSLISFPKPLHSRWWGC